MKKTVILSSVIALVLWAIPVSGQEAACNLSCMSERVSLLNGEIEEISGVTSFGTSREMDQIEDFLAMLKSDADLLECFQETENVVLTRTRNVSIDHNGNIYIPLGRTAAEYKTACQTDWTALSSLMN